MLAREITAASAVPYWIRIRGSQYESEFKEVNIILTSVVVHIDCLNLDFSREFNFLLTMFRPSCVGLLQVRNTTITERKQSKSNQTKRKECEYSNRTISTVVVSPALSKSMNWVFHLGFFLLLVCSRAIDVKWSLSSFSRWTFTCHLRVH